MAYRQDSDARRPPRFINKTSPIWVEKGLGDYAKGTYQTILDMSVASGYFFAGTAWMCKEFSQSPEWMILHLYNLHRRGWIKISSIDNNGRPQRVIVPRESPDFDLYEDVPHLLFLWEKPFDESSEA